MSVNSPPPQGQEEVNQKARTSEPLANDILNSLTAHVAVLDSSGVIVVVNEAWKRFANENNYRDGTSFVGANYLTVCEDAVRRGGDETVAAALNGIRAVLHGEQDTFALEYPCDSPDEKRWFLLRVTLLSRTRRAVVVAHEDITAQKRTESALRETEQELLRNREALEVANRELREALAREQQMARTDGLTGLSNRRHFLDLAEHECAVARRYRSRLSLMMFDIDHFKGINDTFGHQFGDEVLKRVARTAAEHLRAADIVARYGGEEFIVLLSGTDARQAAVVAERIREAIAADGIQSPTGPVTATISVGVAETSPGAETLNQLIRLADRALYRAKGGGRNRTVVSSAVDREETSKAS